MMRSMSMERPGEFYPRHYRAGGDEYDLDSERRTLLDVVAPLAGWVEGGRIIEVGAGMGHHSEILRQAGYKVTGVELTSEGVEQAARLYPELRMVCADAADWYPGRWRGSVFARGMSWYHYELGGVNRFDVDVPDQTARIFERWMNPRDTFTLQIVTDLSGVFPGRRVCNNTIDDYRRLFENFGDVEIYDWSGQPLPGPAGYRHDRGVIVVTTKPANT